jgi:hypothetical protein
VDPPIRSSTEHFAQFERDVLEVLTPGTIVYFDETSNSALARTWISSTVVERSLRIVASQSKEDCIDVTYVCIVAVAAPFALAWWMEQ